MEKSKLRRIILNKVTLVLLPMLISVPVFAQKIQNPVNADSIEALMGKLIEALLQIIIPFIILTLVLTGTYFVLARGSKEKLQLAKRMIVGTAIGTSIILGAWLIAKMVMETVKLITEG
jgi:uncharacterized BrkB/YihY/UPF0761 family membrane protein